MGAFEKALSFTLRWEGGYVNHPDDPGGATNFGVTQGVYNAFRKSKGLETQTVRIITKNEVDEIYLTNYWGRANCDDVAHVSEELAAVHFDSAVNHGVGQANKFLQRTVGVDADGIFGNRTMTAVRLAVSKGDDVVSGYIGQREIFYRTLVHNKPKMGVFLKGWLNRIESLRKFVDNFRDPVAHLASDTVKRLQVLCSDSGIDVGSHDGIPGPKTEESAIKLFSKIFGKEIKFQ